jgi:hypothetical protein
MAAVSGGARRDKRWRRALRNGIVQGESTLCDRGNFQRRAAITPD